MTTKNKRLNFLQYVETLLKARGWCAIVVPDHVLFEGAASLPPAGSATLPQAALS